MAPRERLRRVRPLATNVPDTGSTNKVHVLNEMSSNPHVSIWRRSEEGMFDPPPPSEIRQKI